MGKRYDTRVSLTLCSLIIPPLSGQFEVHRCILSSSGHGIKYREWEMLLSGLSSEALDVTLQ